MTEINTRTQTEAYKRKPKTEIQDALERLAKMEEMLHALRYKLDTLLKKGG